MLFTVFSQQVGSGINPGCGRPAVYPVWNLPLPQSSWEKLQQLMTLHRTKPEIEDTFVHGCVMGNVR